MSKKRLTGQTVSLASLSHQDRCRLFEIYFKYFENVTRDIFLQHISHKEHVILLKDKSTLGIKGFSTIKNLQIELDGETEHAVFSGDTIIEKDYWGELELGNVFLYYCGKLSAALPAGKRLYWLLISKGYKTYRYLPVYYRHFYPSCERPDAKRFRALRDGFAGALYPDEFDRNTGLITFQNRIGNLRQGVGDITPFRLQNPHVAFFNQLNPNHKEGIELACVTEISAENLKGIGKKMFLKGFHGIPDERYCL